MGEREYGGGMSLIFRDLKGLEFRIVLDGNRGGG